MSHNVAVVIPEKFPEESTPDLGWDKGYESGYKDALDEVTRLDASPVSRELLERCAQYTPTIEKQEDRARALSELRTLLAGSEV